MRRQRGCHTDPIAAGINWAIGRAHVVNLSLAHPWNQAHATAVAQAWSAGMVVVAGAGNNGGSAIVYPAAYPNVVGVSGVRADKSFATTAPCPNTSYSASSNSGPHVDLAAPFEAYSTVPGGYATLCGTSMSAPHVAGVAALVKSQHPGWTNQQIVDHLFATAEDRGPAGRDDQFGHGIVRALSPLRVDISEPFTVSGAGSYTWYAYAAGGFGGYTYQWEYRAAGASTWTAVGTGSAYTRFVANFASDFSLRVTVASGGATVSDVQPVDVVPAPQWP